MEQNFPLSPETEKYLSAQRSLILSNGDGEFKDTVDHSEVLVLDVIKSYGEVFLKPMLARAEAKK